MDDPIRKSWREIRRTAWRASEIAQDRAWGVSTTSWRQPRAEWQAEVNGYEPIPYRALPVLDAHLPVRPDDVVYDIGCGKGRLVCHFARKSVVAVVGVEYAEDLVETARQNLASMKRRRAETRIILGDAVAQDYGDASLILMYNPFGATLMRPFIDTCLATRRKPLRFVYLNPTQAAILDANPNLTPAGEFRIPYDLSSCRVRLWTAPAP